ncbi:diaminobutyrate acetyltransferase [Mycolicibacterium gilvum]|uniref:L-2,4-diaminobutyric acid acetyltransferase n=1 Tax=Mycolicibacterium gilvum TaxID=1804 RepID=A0A378SLA9_9MYCO|nr:diaminobutyrate acetyltransferase [Mycolicibacterium gilvum]MCV7059181.1 diaminobutyrate acetyltransferase [Mycolicibacterium gilvum]STZ42177.1 L-2,4-diaminobutyric acid acetyltransferase [Mycolicibacterium gilvum]
MSSSLSETGVAAPPEWTLASKDSVVHRNSWGPFLRRPESTDALAMHKLVADTEVLDLNSTYTYLLMATDFADTTIVADRDGDLCGLITGYHPPTRPDVLFVWQVAVARSAQGTGLAGTMLDSLVGRVHRARCGHPVTVEATVAPSNSASRALFGGFARRHGVPLVERPHFTAAQLDSAGAHEDEPILRIGPIVTSHDA